LRKSTFIEKSEETFCRMCDERCGIIINFADGRIVDVTGSKNHPISKGRTCVKARVIGDYVYSPQRLLKPLKKTNKGWEEIDLDRALDEIAEKIKCIQSKYGNKSVGVWKGEAIGFNQQEDYARRFAHAQQTPTYLSNNTQCSMSRKLGYISIRGHYPAPDVLNSKCIVIWGANPMHSAAPLANMVMEARKKGAKLIVIDPKCSSIAMKADIFAQVKPATDGALALGLINRTICNKWYDEDFVANYTLGFEELKNYAAKFTDQYVEKETGVSGELLNKIAKMFCDSSPRSAILTGNGLEHCQNAVNNIRAIACIGALTGCIDHLGGDFIPECPNLKKLRPDWEKVVQLGPVGYDKYPALAKVQENHTLLAMDAMLSGKPYPIKGIIMTGANPVLTNANAAKVIEAFSSLELLVVRDLFLTKTAELADYILPGASFLERSEIIYYNRFQTIALTKKIIEFENCQCDYQFWRGLAARLDLQDYFPWENEEEVNNWLLEPMGLTVDILKKHPYGIQYSPKKYQKYREKQRPFDTLSGKIEFTSLYLKELGYSELPIYTSPGYISCPERKYPYVLVSGARNVRYCHSRYHNIERLVKDLGPEIEISPEDAVELGVQSGDVVQVTSEVNAIKIPVKVCKKGVILKGTVHIVHGWDEANVNLLTPDDKNDPISGFPLLKAVPVRIAKV
jgi:anaerobic selenocysteine-containing dehydrogenase